MSAHTPGPWLYATDIGQVGSIELADGTVIAQTQQLLGDFDRNQRDANARLIAAAPELLEALQGFMRNGMDGVEEYESAVRALTKALGKFEA